MTDASKIDGILSAITRRTNSLAKESKAQVFRSTDVRLSELIGMANIIELLTDADVPVPAILAGAIRAEINRLGDIQPVESVSVERTLWNDVLTVLDQLLSRIELLAPDRDAVTDQVYTFGQACLKQARALQ
jgi:hypothetical protein